MSTRFEKEQKTDFLKELIEANPSWSYSQYNMALRERFGSGMRKQDVFDWRHLLTGTVSKGKGAPERIAVKGALPKYKKPRFKVPKEVQSSPFIQHGKKFASSPRRMPRPDLPHKWYADIELYKQVDTKDGNRKTRYVKVVLGTFTRDQFVRAFRAGEILQKIKSRILETAEFDESGYDTLGYWVGKQYSLA